MANEKSSSRGLAVPSGRWARLARLGGMASGVVGGMAAQGARELASGRRPVLGDLLLTPANARRVANRLAEMRGAAMKMGQLISMEAGDMLPAEWAEIMSRLRADAHPMPGRQLKAVLTAHWGENFMRRFERFDVEPMAAASIGQVHRAITRDGRDLAIKVQYPGVRNSIDSDVDNVAALIRYSGMVPRELDLAPLLTEAKRQLHEETDYRREGAQMRRFQALLADDDGFAVPSLQEDLTTSGLLAMTYLGGGPIERLETAPQAERDRVATRLWALYLRELFEFRLMQTDPNFANYRFDGATREIVLLDFGATRAFDASVIEPLRDLMRAGLQGDREAVRAAAVAVGVFEETTQAHHQEMILEMLRLALEPFREDGLFDFGARGYVARLHEAGMALGADQTFWHIPPIDLLFVQRKAGGLFLLSSRLKARVDVRALAAPYL